MKRAKPKELNKNQTQLDRILLATSDIGSTVLPSVLPLPSNSSYVSITSSQFMTASSLVIVLNTHPVESVWYCSHVSVFRDTAWD